MRVTNLVPIAALALVLHPSFATAQTAEVLGPFPISNPSGRTTTHMGLSGDGSCLAGSVRIDGSNVPARWFLDAPEPEPILSLQRGPKDVSDDCSVLAGDGRIAPAPTGFAFRWTEGTGEVLIGYLPNTPPSGPFSEANAISGDGSTIVGRSSGPSSSVQHAYRWTDADGMIDLDPQFAGSTNALDVSDDGRVIVGSRGSGAFRWSDGVTELLPDLPGGADQATAYAVSDDGEIVVGSGNPTTDSTLPKAVRWVDGVPQDLGDLPGNKIVSRAYAVSADGEVVVGASSATGGVGLETSKAFLWTSRMGMRSVEDILADDFQIDLAGLVFESAIDISDDGLVIVVQTDTSFGAPPVDKYVVRLPYLPGHPACDDHADDDGDGLVDFPDDPGCQTADGTVENPKCDNDLDDDGDGKIDWDGGAGGAIPDPQCISEPSKNREGKGACGVGAELAIVLALARIAERRRAV